LYTEDKHFVLKSFKKNFDLILFIKIYRKRQDLLIDELKKSGIKYDTGKLNIGDFAWVARSKSVASFLATDIMLNHIVERKRMDDLCASIIDGRYKEQKVGINIFLRSSFASFLLFLMNKSFVSKNLE
jgi:ERCC4-type nuclease